MQLIGNWKLVVMERYAKFDGRASRAEFWWFVLANLVVHFVLALLSQAADIFVVVEVLYALAVIVPTIAVGIRRLHDTDRSGWLLLLAFIPIIGGIVLVVFYATAGTDGANKFGAAAEPAIG